MPSKLRHAVTRTHKPSIMHCDFEEHVVVKLDISSGDANSRTLRGRVEASNRDLRSETQERVRISSRQ